MNFKSAPFRAATKAACLSGLILVFSSCEKYLNDAAPSEKPVEIQQASFNCLNNLSPVLGRVFKGQVIEAEVDEAFACLHESLEYFRDHTKGTTEDSYAASDLSRFLNKNLLQNNQITESFQNEIMKLKKLFLGGDQDVLTKDELTRLIQTFDVSKDELKKLGPHLPLLLIQKNVESNRAEIQVAISQLKSSTFVLFDLMQIESTDYDLNDASLFIQELIKYIKNDQINAQLKEVREYIPIVQSGLDVFYSSDRRHIPLPELKKRSDALLQAYGFWLEYDKELKKNKAENPQQMSHWLVYSERIMDFVEKDSDLLTKGFSYAAIHEFFVELDKKDIIPLNLTPHNLTGILKIVFQKIADPRHQLTPDLRVITASQWKVVRWEYEQWRVAQEVLASAPVDAWTGQISSTNLLRWMRSYPLDRKLTQDGWVGVEKQKLLNSWLELQSLMSQRRPIKFGPAGGIVIIDTAGINALSQTWVDLLRFNSMRALSRALFIGYSNHNNFNLFGAQISEKQLTSWYEDFTPIGVELQFFDPRSVNSGQRSFLEANHFTAYSDGSGGIDFNEGFQYVSYLFSGGLFNANQLYDIMTATSKTTDSIQTDNCSMKEIDILGKPYLEESCFKKNFKKKFGQIFANLPFQVHSVAQMSEAEWNNYYNLLMNASRQIPANAGIRVETSDVRTLVMISHYVESLFTQFDTDRNGQLSFDEIKIGSPRFIPFMRKIKPGLPDFVMSEAFAVFVVTGEVPDLKDLTSNIWDNIWGANKYATRLNLLQAIAALKDGLKKN